MARCEACSLLFSTHGELLRLIAASVHEHFEGLRSAGAHLRRQGLVDSATAKKLARLDDAFAIMRHVTSVSCSDFVEHIRQSLSQQQVHDCSDVAQPDLWHVWFAQSACDAWGHGAVTALPVSELTEQDMGSEDSASDCGSHVWQDLVLDVPTVFAAEGQMPEVLRDTDEGTAVDVAEACFSPNLLNSNEAFEAYDSKTELFGNSDALVAARFGVAATRSICLTVRNTFIEIAEPRLGTEARVRAASAPGRKLPFVAPFPTVPGTCLAGSTSDAPPFPFTNSKEGGQAEGKDEGETGCEAESETEIETETQKVRINSVLLSQLEHGFQTVLNMQHECREDLRSMRQSMSLCNFDGVA